MKKALVIGALLLGISTLLIWRLSPGAQQRSANLTSSEKESETPAPKGFRRIGMAAATQSGEAIEATNSIYQRILAGDRAAITLSPDTIHAYLRSNAFSAESLLAAFQAGTNREFLLTAATNFPRDPRVQFAVLMHNVLPEQRAEWIARFKQDAPDNALPNYLAAREAFKTQQPDVALRELGEAAGKLRFHDYTVESMQSLEELYLADGRSPAEAKVAGMSTVLLPHLQTLVDLSKDTMTLQKELSSQGNASADLLAASVAQLGRQLNSDDSVSLLNRMVGAVIETRALGNYSADASPEFLAMRVEERREQLQQQRQAVREASQYLEQWIATANERDIVTYFDRVKLFGEFAALDWLRARNTAQ